jgi:Lar family restriction alleviation protein
MKAPSEMKKCPFCGNTAKEEFSIHMQTRIIGSMGVTVFNAVCSCGAMGPDSCSMEEAVRRWNRRTKGDDSL